MIVVCEGMDGAGKTTLIEKLVAAHRGPSKIVKRSQLRGDPITEYEWRDLREYDGSQLLVCDRWHVGEMIYGPLYRDRSALEPAQARHVEMVLDAMGALKLHVTAPFEVILKRIAVRGEEFLQPNHFGIVWDFYRDYASVTPGWETVDTSRDYDPSQLLRTARMRAASVRSITAESYAGPPAPAVLVTTGTRTRSSSMPRYRFAATPTVADPRSVSIMRQIEASDRAVGVMAVCDGDDLRSTWHSLGQPPVLAIDQAAQTAACAVGLDSTPTPPSRLTDAIERAVRS